MNTIKVKAILDAEVSDREIANILWMKIQEMTGIEDDAGCDWMTDGNKKTFISGPDWHVSNDEVVASMVDVANFLTHGVALRL